MYVRPKLTLEIDLPPVVVSFTVLSVCHGLVTVVTINVSIDSPRWDSTMGN